MTQRASLPRLSVDSVYAVRAQLRSGWDAAIETANHTSNSPADGAVVAVDRGRVRLRVGLWEEWWM